MGPRADAADVGEEEAGEEEEGQEEEEKEEEEGQEEEEEEKEEEEGREVPGRKRPKGVHKSKASIAAGKKIAAAQKKKGIGLFATKTLSADLAAICGKTKMSRPEMTKALWGYIKKNKLNKGRTIAPDAKLKKVLPANSLSMFKMPGMLKKHIKLVRGREHEASQSHAQRSSST